MDWGADRPVLLRLYRSLVRSKLDYGCVVYSSARGSYLRKLLPIHNQGLGICLGAFRTSPMQSIYIEANEPPLQIRWEKLSLQFAMKLRSHRHNPTFETAFNHRFSHIYLAKPTVIPPFAARVKEALSKYKGKKIAWTHLLQLHEWDQGAHRSTPGLATCAKDILRAPTPHPQFENESEVGSPVHSFVERTQELLKMDGVEYVLSDKYNQHPIEEFFGKQRIP
ncbi:hypothetical protein HOLleu_01530 [Holothuria leucospilota]|uniref:Uncharacterized protein n=1 Tax=Holothuria leucospilota TaxID=206669 RepID=A0A9Q1CQ34_HOLLE|nr:hypothetical protein HOLleu_01530 [Holothuria leucospilota]